MRRKFPRPPRQSVARGLRALKSYHRAKNAKKLLLTGENRGNEVF